MRLISGADGCRGGWVFVTEDLDTGDVAWELRPTAADLIHGSSKRLVTAVDVPIGLPDAGSRACDRQARGLLGRRRGSSVFPAPIRPVLDASTYAEACDIRFQIDEKRLSRQTWAIVPRIRAVDRMLREQPWLQERVREVHPEVSFYFMAGEEPMQYSKKAPAGREARRQLLLPHYGSHLERALAERRELASSPDDMLDAFAALWTARRIVTKTAKVLPDVPPRDAAGLRMEIVA